jgi:hypothetical protein
VVLPSGYPTKILNAFLIFAMHATLASSMSSVRKVDISLMAIATSHKLLKSELLLIKNDATNSANTKQLMKASFVTASHTRVQVMFPTSTCPQITISLYILSV